MRAVLGGVVLVLLFVLVRSSKIFDGSLVGISPIVFGYGALFAAGIVTSELFRPLLAALAPSSRFVMVALMAGLVWFAIEQARLAGTIPDAVLGLNRPSASAGGSQPPPSTRIPVAWDGVYRAVAQVNKTSLGVVIDTATPLVILQYEEAERLGFEPQKQEFTTRLTVSDRKINAALYLLSSVRLDGIELFGVKGAIAQKGALQTSLIGLSFLNRLSAFGLANGQMVLRQ
ncbi:MAG: TIGR02281 family clan AA aspartic protease [Alphaproteobacteria bacterium]|nr:TIGR02281 family clan AA aspartic protease [Alphaproteobacteria bacterium]